MTNEDKLTYHRMVYTNRLSIAQQAYIDLSSGVQKQLCKWAGEFGYVFPTGPQFEKKRESRDNVLKMICPCANTDFPRRLKRSQASMESFNSDALASRISNVFWLLKDQIFRYEQKLANILRKNKFESNAQGTFICKSKDARLKYTSNWLKYYQTIVKSCGNLEVQESGRRAMTDSIYKLTFLVQLLSQSAMNDDQRKCIIQVDESKNTVLEYSCTCEKPLSTLQPCKHIIFIMEKQHWELENPPKHILVKHYLQFCQVCLYLLFFNEILIFLIILSIRSFA